MSLDDATGWFAKLQEKDLPVEALEEWRNWIAVAENRERFDRVERLWSALDGMPRPEIPSPAEASAGDYDGNQSFESWKVRRSRAVPGSRPRVQYGIAAAITIAVGVCFVAVERRQPAHLNQVAVFETAIGEHRKITLSDGSRIQLAARSAVTVSMNAQMRTIVLNGGEALFQVARDPARPFNVMAGEGMITALGTAFNVRKREDGAVFVTVTEGVVQVMPSDEQTDRRRLARGEQISYDAKGQLSTPAATEDRIALSWQHGLLQYRREPLRNVLSDVNRYSHRQIVLGDSIAGELPFTGTVFERDVEAWIAVLYRTYPQLEITFMDSDKVLIRSRRAANGA